MKNKPANNPSKFLLYYSTLSALFLTLSGFLSVKHIENASFQLIFLPVTMFLFLETSKNLKSSLRKEDSTQNKESIKNTTSWKKYIVFIVVFIILLGIGINNIFISSKGNKAQNTPTDATQSSTPIIFEGEKKIINIKAKQDIKENEQIEIKEEPLFGSKTLDTIKEEKEYEVEENLEDWYKIKLENDSFGYVHKNLVEVLQEVK